jgi:ABC-type dipeptide/oligopeptide/nickel transport system ATPase component
MSKHILEVNELSVSFKTRQGVVRAVDHVSFTVQAGVILGIVGESGCGKSVTARAILSSALLQNR